MKMIDVRRVKPFVLPVAIIMGLLCHSVCESLSVVVPYLIFAILILTFSTTELRKLRFGKLDLLLMLLQIFATVLLYVIFRNLFEDETVAQGMMLAALCPVASSVTVVSGILGAKRENTVAYTIAGNLLICVLAPLVFVLVGAGEGAGVSGSFMAIFGRIAVVIGLPFFVMLLIQLSAHSVADRVRRYSGLSFYLWAMALFLTLGQTIDFIFVHGAGHRDVIMTLGIGAAVLCPLQFYIGRLTGAVCGDAIAGQQLLGQKNSAMGIWMANTYLNPLASTFLAFYSIWQNVLNSWQIYRRERSGGEVKSDSLDRES